MPGRVLLVGEVLVDFLGEGGQRLEEARLFRPAPGGAPANAAVAAARAGARAAFAGCVGRDAFGRMVRAALEDAGVDCRGLVVHPSLCTTLAFVLPAARGELGFQFVRGADAALGPADLPDELFADLAALGCGGVSLSAPASAEATLRAMERARAAGALVLFDVNWRPALWPSAAAGVAALRSALPLCDVLKCNETELALLAGEEGDAAERARRLLRPRGEGPAACAVTLGERGALWVTPTGAWHHPGYAVSAVDAVGAGDCFTGNLLAWWVSRGLPPGEGVAALGGAGAVELLARCNAAAALSTLRPGAMRAMPAAAEVEAFLATRGGGPAAS